MSDLVTEVDEAMKQERIEKLWQKYGGFLIGFIAMIILGTAANEGYKSWNKSQNIKQTNIYLDATQKADTSPEEILSATPKLKNSLKGLAALQAAGLAIEKGDVTTALNTYRKIESDETIDPIAAYIAKYMVTNLDKDLSIDQKRARYESLSSNEDNPLRFHAHVEAAILEAHVAQDYKAAREHLNKILKEPKAAESLKQKAKSLDILYIAKENSSK